MADLKIASMDIAAGLKVKNFVVPPMLVEVVLEDAPADLVKAAAKDKLILQKVMAAAFKALEKTKDTFQGGMRDLDAGFVKKPPADKKEYEDRVNTINVTCKQIVQAQSGPATAAAMAEWNVMIKKNKDMAKYKIGFAFRTVLGTIGVAAAVATAVLSMGTLAVTIVGAAKTVVGMAADIYNFCRDMEKTEKDIIATDAELSKVWKDDKKSAGKVGRELAAALGVPFVKGIGTQEKLLTEYNAKNAMKDKKAETAWSNAKKLMAEIVKLEQKAAASAKANIVKLSTAVTALLDKISELSAASKSNDLFYKINKDRCDTYKAFQGKSLGGAATATGIFVLAAGLASLAKTVLEIAMKLPDRFEARPIHSHQAAEWT